MDNRKYSVIVFDLGNVLIPFDYDIAVNKLEEIEPGLGSRFIKYYRDNYHIHRNFEKGTMAEADFIGQMINVLEEKVTKDEFCRIYSEVFSVNENVASLLPQLKKKYQLVLLSNTNAIHKKYGWEQYDFLVHFDKLILSHEVGAVKPEPEIYKAVTDYTGKPPEEHIFIDDIKEYAEAAKNMGWDAVQFQGYEKLITDLKQRGIL